MSAHAKSTVLGGSNTTAVKAPALTPASPSSAAPGRLLSPAIDLGTVQIWQHAPEVSDFVKLACSLSLGADNFNAYRQRVAPRREDNIPGVWSNFGHGNAGMTVRLEAFGETSEALQSAIRAYLETYPPKEFDTRFFAPEIIDGEWIARGSRYVERNWA